MTNGRTFILSLLLLISHRELLAATLYQDPLFGVQITSDITYGAGLINNGANSLALKLDFYQPTNIGTPVPAARPTILFVHGGSWQEGSKSDIPQANVWTSRGYNVASIDYRLLGDNPPLTNGAADLFAGLASLLGPPGIVSEINASIDDTDLALEWLYSNAGAFGVDPTRIGIAGHSAGATIALAVGYLSPSEHVQPRAVISTSGALFNIPSPFPPGGPPAFVVGGQNDSIVPIALVQITSDQMNENGVENELYIQLNTGHSTNWNQVTNGKTLSQHAVDFLARELAPPVPEPSSIVLALIAAIAVGLPVAQRRRTRTGDRHQ